MRTSATLLLSALLLAGCNKAGEEPKPDASAVKPADPPAVLPLPPVSAPGAKKDAPPPIKTPEVETPAPKPKAPPGNPSPELLAAIVKLNGYESGFGRQPNEPIHFQFRDPGPTDVDLATLRTPLLNSNRPVHLNFNGCTSISDAGIAHLADIPMLRRLSLGDTKVTDAGLKVVGTLELDELYLSSPAITDAGVARLAPLTKLKKLGLYGAKLTASSFAHLANMAELEELNTSTYEYGDDRLQHLTKLTKLKKLTVGSDKLTDAGMAALKNFTELRELRVEGEKVTEAGVAHLAGLTKVQKLTVLRGAGFKGDALAALGGMTELQELELIYTPTVDKAGGAQVGKLKTLRKLRFGSTTADGLAGIAGLDRLEDLDLNYSGATDEGMKHLGGLISLKSLNLYATRVTAAGLKHLTPLTGIKTLNLSENKQITDDALAPVAELPRLEGLWASNCTITGSGFKHVVKHPTLKELGISGNPVTDEHAGVLKDMARLTELNLTGTKVSDEIALELKKARPNLRVRDASGDEVTATPKPPKPKPKIEDLTAAKADFTLVADAFYKEYQADKSAAERKYKGKVIELTGEAESHGRNFSGDAYVSLKVEKQLIGVMCFTADEEPWSKAVKGQKVKIKGKWPEFSVGATLLYCVFVETGEYKAITITAAELAKEYAADGAATVKKYDGKHLKLTGEVLSKESNSAGAATVHLKVDGKVKVVCGFTAAEKDVVKPLKAGQKLTVIGEFTLNSDGRDEVNLYFCQVLTKP